MWYFSGTNGNTGGFTLALLTAAKVKALNEPGRYSDGEGLHLFVRKSGTKAWVHRFTVDGRRRDIGLGGYPAVSLAKARERAEENRAAIADGRDLQAEKRRAVDLPSFREAADRTIGANKPRWRHSKTATNWKGSLETYAFPLFGDIRVDHVGRGDVLAVLEPIWTTKPATARKLRQRIRTVFSWAMAHGFIELNPAGEVINAALPPMPAVKAHFRALPYGDVGKALETIEESSSSLSSRLCLRFLVLTAARSGEARSTLWDEIDFEEREWRIPATRMKSGVEHRVPLSDISLDVLQQALSLDDNSGLVFPSTLKPGRPLSDMTLTKILRSVGLADRATVHGFRTSFRTWAMERTDTPWAVGEAALAHTLGNSTEQAYARSDLFERRRVLMQQWADYLLARRDH